MKTRIIVDCTHTFQTGAGTGIQRVVRQFADALLELAREPGPAIVPVRIADGQLVPLPVAEGRVAFPRSGSAREAAGTPVQRPRAWARWLDGALEATPNEDSLARRVARFASTPRHADALRITADDILLSLDSSWVYDIRTALETAGRAGATRIAVLCDVLPLSHPEFFTEGTRRYFRAWLEVLLPHLEGLVTISTATADELRDLVSRRELRVRNVPECATVHLGAEIADAKDSYVRPELRSLMGPGHPPAFLTVGTLEPRKNVDFALDIFDALRARHLDLHWHVIGAPGWLAEHTASRIRNHPEYGERIHWWTDLRDGELAWAYDHAAALVAVSKAEGFGLPLVEARFHGLPVFASDIPVFREVLGKEGRFLPLSSARLAAVALQDFLEGRLPPVSPSAISRPWVESARELLEVVLRMHGARGTAPDQVKGWSPARRS